MKKLGHALGFACALIAGCTGVASAHRHGPVSAVVEINYFYDALEPYGFWITIDPYGPVWVPTDVPADWRPYTNGYWTCTDYGWTWVDYAEWGWAPFHYGRWAYDRWYGWVWVPDTVWGPAWVAWRLGDGIIGWAPLPPEAHWRIGIGFVTDGWWFGAGIGLDGWCFVPDRHFLHHHVRQHFMPRHRAEHCFRVTRDRTDYGYEHDRIVNRGVPVRDVERMTGKRVRQHVIVDRGPQEQPGRTVQRGNEVRVYRPPFRSSEEARVIHAPAPDRGVKPERQATQAQPPEARTEQGRPRLERRDEPSRERTDASQRTDAGNRTDARRRSSDNVQLQKEREKAAEQPQKEEPRKPEPRKARERQQEPQQERTRRR